MSLIYKPFKSLILDSIRNSLDTFNNVSNNYLYIFASRATPFSNNDITPDTVVESISESSLRPYHEMMFGKLVANTNVAYLAKNNIWASGTVYTQYDDTYTNLYNEGFYVLSKYTTTYRVYKCLYNNGGDQSTVDPGSYSSGYTSPFNPFTLSDGYTWKYMFNCSLANYNNFSFGGNYIPYFPPNFISAGDDISGSLSVQQTSNDSISVILLTSSGNNYTAVASGTVQNIDSSNSFITLQANTSQANNVYAGSSIYLKQIAGSNTFLRKITNYFGTNNTLIVDSPVAGVSGLNYTYSINPSVIITGDGTGATAFCNTVAGQVKSITVLTGGTGYTRANVSISSNNIYGTGAVARAILPPGGGHGNNAVNELGINNIGLYVKFTGSESNTIPYNITYRTVGLLRNPSIKDSPGTAYSNNTFNQTMDITFTNPIAFNINDVITGYTSYNQGIVVFSNTSITTLVGDKKFVVGETVTNTNSTISAVISTIARLPNLEPFSGDILYLNNINKVTRSYGNNETIQIAIQL